MTTALLNDRYRILRSIGQGGFGETFLAEDTQMPSGRWCVVKLLKPIAANPQVCQLVRDRFEREAVILEELGKENTQIPELYAYFESKGQFYLVQEYIEGETLTRVVPKRGKLSESSVRDFLINILPVLEYVHGKGIIHRDIKPDNIILRNLDNKPILIDFGAVRETMGMIVTPSGTPTSSIVIGTPGFMPSEQGVGRPVFSSDLYALGLTAIYLLTEKAPQDLETNPLTGEIIWRQSALNISPTFGEIIDRAIKSHARDRFSTAREMLDALQHRNIPVSPTLTSVSSTRSPQHIMPDIMPAITPNLPQNNNRGVILGSLIIGSLVSAGVVFGFALTHFSSSESNEVTNSSIPSPSLTPSPRQTSQYVPPPKPSNLPASIGWIRVGAVANSSGNTSIGEKLIKTTQPITISPGIVPAIGQKITIINNVNYRINYPQAPIYKLSAKQGELFAGQELIILNLKTFVDPTVSSSYTVVWAEVGLP